jgi:hypothetical protein
MTAGRRKRGRGKREDVDKRRSCMGMGGGKREKEEGEEGERDVGESRSQESCGERGLEESV